jgi:hypothetical protein
MITNTVCIRCGGRVGPNNCEGCTWPYSPEGWASTTRKARRITLDIGGVNAKRLDANLNQLEQWRGAGLIELQRSKVFLEEFRGPAHHVAKAESIKPHPPGWRLGGLGSALGEGPGVLYAEMPERERLRKIMFPSSRHLTSNQEYDIRHVQHHVETGGDLFVTTNLRDFIKRDKQKALYSIGIWAFLPEQAVHHIRRYVL